MEILEELVQAKGAEHLCEDIIFYNNDFAAVIDGASDKTGVKIAGMSGGRFVAETIRTVCEIADYDLRYRDWVDVCTAAIASQLKAYNWPEGLQLPAASVVVYSRHRREIWRVGDCNFRILRQGLGGISFLGSKLIDQLNAERRSMAVRKALLAGQTIDDCMRNDPGRLVILPRLQTQYLHANNEFDPLGYPVMNGDPIPAFLLEEPVSVPQKALVILSSDGFTDLKDSLHETLVAQQALYETDPLMIGMNGAAPCVKGLTSRNGIHDDRAWLSLVS